MIAAILAAALQSPHTTRYVRLQMNVDGYGMRGSATLLVDRQRARYTEHFNLGPQSFYQGFDGVRAWQADVAGTTAIEGNSLDRALVIDWGALFAFPRRLQSGGSVTSDSNGRLRRFKTWNGLAEETAVFSGYHTFADGVTAPQSIRFADDNGTWIAQVKSVQTLHDVSANAFAPPARAPDSSIAGGQTSVPFLVATEIVVPVRINDGPVMHFILDTGGQNVLNAQAAKRLRLQTVGHGTVGGAGAGVVPTTFATVRSVRIGAAEMRNQPFLVIDSSVLQGIDGIVGYELLSRFAARVDYRTNTLTLASNVPRSWTAGVQMTPFVFRSRAPQIAGTIDAFAAPMTIDTGNSGVLDINAPFALAHHLWAYYHAGPPKRGDLVGVGGGVAASPVTVRRLTLNPAELADVHGTLTQAQAGIEADASFAANLGEGVFRNFTLVFDYAHQALYFAPGGIRDMSGVLFTRRGKQIVVSGLRTRTARALGIRAGMILTALNGRSVGDDLQWVQSELQNRPAGTKVRMVFNGNMPVTLQLLNYL